MSSSPQSRRPIFYKGELYLDPISKRGGGGEPKFPRSLDEAKSRILGDLDRIYSQSKEIDATHRMPSELIISMRIEPGFSAKSYHPSSLLKSKEEGEIFSCVGSKSWRPEELGNEDTDSRYGKTIFLRGTEKSLESLRKNIENSTTKSFQNDLRKINRVDFLSGDEQIKLPIDWDSGVVESVFHPFALDENLLKDHFQQLFEKLGGDVNSVKFIEVNGIKFVKFTADKQIIHGLKGYNPLRTLHPLVTRVLPDLRSSTQLSCPKPPLEKIKSSIIVGIFDGGSDSSTPLLNGFCESIEATKEPEYSEGIAHGTAVAGAVLYGPLNNYAESDHLPNPVVSVRSFRVLPTQSNYDPDLYDVIESMQSLVPEQSKYTKVFNLSLGPKGPIIDDDISSFTAACDYLSYKYGVLFTVAVGNDGIMDEGLDRIQSPSDGVNCLSVGSYSHHNGDYIALLIAARGLVEKEIRLSQI